MKLQGTVHVLGRAGPFEILTEEALRGIHEKLDATLADGGRPVVALRGSTDVVVAAECTAAELVAPAGQRGWRLDLDLEVDDDRAAELSPRPALLAHDDAPDAA